MANQLGPFPVEFGAVFPSGAYAAGAVEKVRDFEKSSGDRMVQQTDKHTGLPLWVVEVIDADPEARLRTVKVKVAAQYQPVLPDTPAGSPFTPVEFEGLTATAWVEPGRRSPLNGRSWRCPRSTPWPPPRTSDTAPWCCWPRSPACGGVSWQRCAAPNVDIQARTVRVVRQLNERDGGGFTFRPPKSEAGVGIVAIPELITPDLAAHVMTYARPGDDGLVFTSPGGGPLRHTNFRRRFWCLPWRRPGSPPCTFTTCAIPGTCSRPTRAPTSAS